MIRVTDRFGMNIAVGWDVKPQTKPNSYDLQTQMLRSGRCSLYSLASTFLSSIGGSSYFDLRPGFSAPHSLNFFFSCAIFLRVLITSNLVKMALLYRRARIKKNTITIKLMLLTFFKKRSHIRTASTVIAVCIHNLFYNHFTMERIWLIVYYSN